MHILDVSTNIFVNASNRSKLKDFANNFFESIKRAIAISGGFQIESNGWYIGNDNRMHLELIILSDVPSDIEKICDVIEDRLSVPKRALVFTK